MKRTVGKLKNRPAWLNEPVLCSYADAAWMLGLGMSKIKNGLCRRDRKRRRRQEAAA